MRLLVKIDTEEKKEMKIHPYKKPLCSSRIFLPPLSTIQFKQTYRRTNKQTNKQINKQINKQTY